MEFITDEVVRNILSSCGESVDIESIRKHSSEPGTGHGDNYCSNIIRTQLEIKLTSGKIFRKSLILKTFLEELEPDARVEMKQFFANEVTMYGKILVNLGKLAEENNFDFPRAWPRCYFATTDFLIFDDLKEEGFVVIPRQQGLTLAQGLEIIRYLGRLHGLSVVAERRKLINPSLIRKVYTWAQQDSFIVNIYTGALRIVGDIVSNWGTEWADIGEKIVKYAETMPQTLDNLFHENVKLKVVNHGDAYINNVLVKYSPDQTIEDIRFVDFQNATYNSPGWDLVYFLFSSLHGEDMINNYDLLLSTYRNEFVETLVKLDEDPNIAPTMEEIKSDIVRLHPFCLVMTAWLLGVVFNDSKHSIQIDELVTNEFKLRSLFANDNWKNSFRVYVKYFQKHGVL